MLTQNDDLCIDLCLTGATSVATPVIKNVIVYSPLCSTSVQPLLDCAMTPVNC